jgi:hypothetical protein
MKVIVMKIMKIIIVSNIENNIMIIWKAKMKMNNNNGSNNENNDN